MISRETTDSNPWDRIPGDPFGDDAHPRAEVAHGRVVSLGDERVLGIPRSWLFALKTTLEGECGPSAAAITRDLGRSWGRSLCQHWSRILELHAGQPVRSLPLAVFLAALSSAARRYGWGHWQIDFSRHAKGLLLVHLVREPDFLENPALLGGLVGGFFSELVGRELDALRLPEEASLPATYVLTCPERFVGLEPRVPESSSRADVLRILEETRA